MGERYDMDHVYYIDGKDWHGASQYYEYPCVFAWVLINTYLGIQYALDVDLVIRPRMRQLGRVELKASRFALAYSLSQDAFTLQNLAPCERTFRVDLAGVHPGVQHWKVETGKGKRLTGPETCMAIAAGETVTFRIV